MSVAASEGSLKRAEVVFSLQKLGALHGIGEVEAGVGEMPDIAHVQGIVHAPERKGIVVRLLQGVQSGMEVAGGAPGDVPDADVEWQHPIEGELQLGQIPAEGQPHWHPLLGQAVDRGYERAGVDPPICAAAALDANSLGLHVAIHFRQLVSHHALHTSKLSVPRPLAHSSSPSSPSFLLR